MFDFLLGNDTLSALVAFGLVLIPAIIIHELGHLFAAKAVGITILEFGVGFPPRIVRLFTIGGTEYTLNWLPLGGFVRPLGEDMVRQVGDEATEKDREEAKARGITQTMSVNEAKPLPRIFFMAAGALANFATALVLFTVIALVGVPQIIGGRVDVVSVTPNSVFAEAGVQPGDQIERLNGEVFAGSEDFFNKFYQTEGESASITVLRPSEEAPVDLTFTPVRGELAAEGYVRVMGVVPEAPAQLAGIAPGDIIAEFNGERVTSVEALQAVTREHLGEEVQLTLIQNGETRTVSIVPRENPPQGEGSMGIAIGPAVLDSTSGLLFQEGEPQQIVVSQSLPAAIQYSLNTTGTVFASIGEFFSKILSGTATEAESRPVSIIGISQAGGYFIQQSIEQNQPVFILNYIALISIALGLTNLLPIPALDGGRILFVLIEVLRGRPMSPEREGMVHFVGLILLLSVGVLFMINDLSNPILNLLR